MSNKLPRLTPLGIGLVALAMAATQGRICAASDPYQAGANASVAAAASAGGLAAAQQPIAQPESKAVGDQLIVHTAARLERRASVSARLHHKVVLPGTSSISGRGSYWQQGMGDELRVRLELQIAEQEASLLQVSNSRFLWVERRLPIGRTVTRLDLRQLRADAVLAGSHFGDIQPGNASWTSSQSDLIANSGGLPSLLSALGESFTFLPPQTMRIAAKTETGQQTTSMPFFAIVGHWRMEKLTKLVTLDEEPGTNPRTVPSRLPEEVLILIGQADLFPYRIEYRKLETPIAANQAGAAIPYQLSANPMVVLEFTDVAFDVSTDTGQFIYTPGDAEWTDRTTAVLERLRQRRDQQVANRTQAAAQPPRK
jgi:hypothetical protein